MSLRKFLIVIVLISILPAAENFPYEKKYTGIKKVVIDAGHGGKDPGNMGTRRYATREKHIALEVALMVGNYIKENMPEVEVVYSRTEDKHVELHERTAMANRLKADLFLSIHCNAGPAAAYGTETFVMGLSREKSSLEVAKRENSVIFLEENYEEKYGDYDPNSPESNITAMLSQSIYLDRSIKFADLIQTEFRERAKRHDRGVKQSVLYVLDFTAMPSVLVELGFTTNRNEEDFLISQRGKELMASAIYRAFRDYKNQQDYIESKNQESHISELDEKIAREAQAANDPKGTYRVQIATSGSQLDTRPENFGGLEDVRVLKEGALYRYTYGDYTDLNEAKKALNEAKKAGYRDAFLIGVYDGKRMSLGELKKLMR